MYLSINTTTFQRVKITLEKDNEKCLLFYTSVQFLYYLIRLNRTALPSRSSAAFCHLMLVQFSARLDDRTTVCLLVSEFKVVPAVARDSFLSRRRINVSRSVEPPN